MEEFNLPLSELSAEQSNNILNGFFVDHDNKI